MKISDGTGTGYEVKVNSDNRLLTQSVNTDKSANASVQGDSFNINTGVITLTSANLSGLLYVKNTGERPIVIETLFYLIGANAGGTGDMLITVWRNPNAGTVVTDQIEAEMAGVNRNFGSAKQLIADVYKGGEGKTLTGGTKVIETLVGQTSQRIAITAGDIIIPKSSSIGVTITPAAGTTSLNLEAALSCYVNGDV